MSVGMSQPERVVRLALLALQVGKAPLTPRDQAANSTGDKDVQKAQEPANKAYRDMAADAAEFQACFSAHCPSTEPARHVLDLDPSTVSS